MAAETTLEQRRAELVPALARMTRQRDFRTAMSKATDGDTLTVIPVLPDDRMSYVFARLAEFGSRGVIAMPIENGGWEIAQMWPASCARLSVAAEDDTVAQIHDDCEVSMLFEYLKTVETIVIQQVAAQRLARA